MSGDSPTSTHREHEDLYARRDFAQPARGALRSTTFERVVRLFETPRNFFQNTFQYSLIPSQQGKRSTGRDTDTNETYDNRSSATFEHEDYASPISAQRVVSLTDQDNKRICWKTDLYILPILVWVYFLQVLDKTTLGYAAVLGLQTDTHLTGNQYSLVGSIAPIAQLAIQPVTSVLIVKVPHRILMPVLILGWGIAQTAMAFCHSYSGLLITRFFLGLFEAGCLPLFSTITTLWYRRAEQPLRVAAWYSMNGVANLFAAAISYLLGHAKYGSFLPWQIMFFSVGLLTIISAPIVFWRLETDVASASFLTELERVQAVERLRTNQIGTSTHEFKWSHVFELIFESKTYLFVGITLLLNLCAQVSNTFGPLILSGFGFDELKTALLNMPFGVLQFIAILLGSWIAQKMRLKSLPIIGLMVPVIIGIILLYRLPRTPDMQGYLMTGFYLFAFLFAGNPLVVSWILGNTAGITKQSVIMAAYQGAASAGNIVGPLLFTKDDFPAYHRGLLSVLWVSFLLLVIVLAQLGNLVLLNRLQRQKRIRNGKSAAISDPSMADRFETGFDHTSTSEASLQTMGAILDLTDGENDEFVYIY